MHEISRTSQKVYTAVNSNRVFRQLLYHLDAFSRIHSKRSQQWL